MCFFFNDTATTEIYTYVHTLSLHDALPICWGGDGLRLGACTGSLQLTGNPSLPNPPLEGEGFGSAVLEGERSEEHTSELQSLMRISYAVFCLKTQNTNI